MLYSTGSLKFKMRGIECSFPKSWPISCNNEENFDILFYNIERPHLFVCFYFNK